MPRETTPDSKPRCTRRRTVAAGTWLRLEQIDYVDRTGEARRWEAAARQQNAGAVLMIPTLRPSGRIVLIEQYRPPVDGPVLEFPAGLIDPGEAPEKTAVRELLEETGYRGEVVWLGPPACSSPGMSSESVMLALVDIDETRPENQAPRQDVDEGEEIEVLVVAPADMRDFLRRKTASGVLLDSRLVAVFLGAGITW